MHSTEGSRRKREEVGTYIIVSCRGQHGGLSSPAGSERCVRYLAHSLGDACTTAGKFGISSALVMRDKEANRTLAREAKKKKKNDGSHPTVTLNSYTQKKGQCVRKTRFHGRHTVSHPPSLAISPAPHTQHRTSPMQQAVCLSVLHSGSMEWRAKGEGFASGAVVVGSARTLERAHGSFPPPSH